VAVFTICRHGSNAGITIGMLRTSAESPHMSRLLGVHSPGLGHRGEPTSAGPSEISLTSIPIDLNIAPVRGKGSGHV
jgi:hypothetical protein